MKHTCKAAVTSTEARVHQRATTTRTLTEAEEASRRVCGFSEVERERQRARRLAQEQEEPAQAPHPEALPHVLARFHAWEEETARHGIDYVTTRRIAEGLGLTAGELPCLKEELSRAVPQRHVPPLWAVTPPRR